MPERDLPFCYASNVYHIRWGYVSSSGFTNEDAQVVCRQLKLPTVGERQLGTAGLSVLYYDSSLIVSKSAARKRMHSLLPLPLRQRIYYAFTGAYVFGNVEPFVGNPGRLILPGLKCTGTESFLGDCPVDKTTATPTQEPAFIFCQEPTFAVRLAGGAHPSEGRLGKPRLPPACCMGGVRATAAPMPLTP